MENLNTQPSAFQLINADSAKSLEILRQKRKQNPWTKSQTKSITQPKKPERNIVPKNDLFLTLDRQVRAAIIVRYKHLKQLTELPSLIHGIGPIIRYMETRKIDIVNSGVQVTFVGNVTKARSSTFHYKCFIEPTVYKNKLKPERDLDGMQERYDSDYIGNKIFEIFKHNKMIDDKISIAADDKVTQLDSILLYGEPKEIHQISIEEINDFISRYCKIFNTTPTSDNWFQIVFIPFRLDLSKKIYWHVGMKIEEMLFVKILEPYLGQQFIEHNKYTKPDRQYD